MEKSLFDKYGGFSTVSKIVLSLYDRLLDDDDVGPFFDDVDLPKLIDHQTKFISALLGGPASFGDDRLRQVHRHLEINHTDMDEMATLLAEALTMHNMARDDIDEVMRLIESKRPLIVYTPA